MTYNTPIGFAKTDVLHPVDADNDDDGVVDFDEYYRFKTDENKYSSADDGLSDYERLYLEYGKDNIQDITIGCKSNLKVPPQAFLSS